MEKIITRKQYNENGTVIAEWEENGMGVTHGTSREFHTNGQLKCWSVYFYGKLHGIETQYNEKGKLLSENRYVNGEKIAA